jgi:hypothetical protein
MTTCYLCAIFTLFTLFHELLKFVDFNAKKAEELVQCMNISSDALIYIKIYCAVSVEEFLKEPNPVPNEVDSRVFQGKLKGKK